MIRREEIVKQGILYTAQVCPGCISGDDPFDKEVRNLNRNKAFEAGAEWADENIKEIWHSTDEYPEEFSDIVIVDKTDDFWKINYFSGDFDNHNHDLYGWPACIELYKAKLWAYVSDLLILPKTK